MGWFTRFHLRVLRAARITARRRVQLALDRRDFKAAERHRERVAFYDRRIARIVADEQRRFREAYRRNPPLHGGTDDQD